MLHISGRRQGKQIPSILLLLSSMLLKDLHRGRRGRDRMQSVPITTKVVSSSPDHDEVYSIQNYVIKFVLDLQYCFFG
jgi:hypothetical protein